MYEIFLSFVCGVNSPSELRYLSVYRSGRGGVNRRERGTRGNSSHRLSAARDDLYASRQVASASASTAELSGIEEGALGTSGL